MKFPHKIILATTLLFTAAPAFSAEEYTLDPTHTAVTWSLSHFGFSSPSGKFMHVDGSIMIDEENPENSSLEVVIPIEKVNTGVEKLDEHIKTAEFFNIAEFPTATFVSQQVELTGEKTAKVEGELTLHGETNPVTLDVTLNKLGENMFGKKTAGFSATGTINRSDYGMTKYLPGLGNEVTLHIEAEANLAE